ncbi:PQQ-dependent sugar dehydrogenase [Confluentibacter lentus]|uniref:PQQ-dependent sugar dehydrogenase n=1 Tax=Confluentibacter lentus TaxID=1699412 RepID=UPI0018E25139|nr:PQQ-dependent sugar dehydrogenase [Confluentibacter lentus]
MKIQLLTVSKAKFFYSIILLFMSGYVFSQVTINYENFESGNFPFTQWNDGGIDCSLNSSSILTGIDSANLQDNSGIGSSMFTNNINLTPYASVSITFNYRTTGFNTGHDFFIEFSNNGGSTWISTPIARYIMGTHFNNNMTYTNITASINNGSTFVFTSNSRFRFRADAADNSDDFYIDEVTISGIPSGPVEPEINVTGNGSSIADGDLYPSTFNNTNFGSVNIGNTSTKIYTINNLGTKTLNISNITLSNTTDFQIVGVPYNATVNAGGNTSFSIRYTGRSGKHSSTVTIESDDSDEGTYDFIIRGSTKATSDTSLWSVTNITADMTLDNPYEITYGPDGKLWISERVGKKIVTIDPDTGGTKTTILDLTSVVYQTAGQDGLMGFDIHPDLYSDINTSNNFVYIAYTYNSSGRKLRISRYTYNAGTGQINSGSATTLIEGIDASNDHNSGRMKIGPDLKIYYTIGDQGANQFGNACNPIRAQDLPTSSSDYGAYKGKVLRLNLDGSIPLDNPTLSGVKSHVYTYGHRNTQGIIFGANGKLYASEHGAKVDDELNIISAGKNYGWPHIAGYYDDLAYGYCNWSSSTSCSSSGFTDHNCPASVIPLSEFNPVNASILLNFQPPIGTYDSTTNYDPSGDWLTWPTVAPSSIDIYEGGLIPDWGSSLLITTLKEGTIFRAKLNAIGDALVDITTDNKFEEFHSSNDRYRDTAMDPDGITFYAITDSSGTTSGPSGSSPVGGLDNPGVVMKFQYLGVTGTTYYVDADGDGFGDIADLGTEYPSDPGAGYSLTNDDCDDAQPLTYPGNTEVLYDGIDNDCNPLTLDTVDADGDGINSDTDCDDNQPLAYPGNTEILYDGIDNDCNPLTLDTVDTDNDGVNSDTDCDDNQPLAYPENTEILYDGIDNDCNPLTLDYEDTDGDGVSNPEDQCPGFDDTIDVDLDGIPDGCDTLIDSDNDGVADYEDVCLGFDDTVDTDADGIADGCDICAGFDDTVDVDADNIPDGCDSLIDSDNDGIADSEDLCPGFDDTVDADTDSIPDGCDPLIDSDNDGVADSEDLCPGFDDTVDVDADSIPDGCDSLIDSDNDGVADSEDLCPGFDDTVDLDGDGISTGCDPDDNNPCVPNANSPACVPPCRDVIVDSFEGNYGNWRDGGSDSALTTSYANSGRYSIQLSDNSGMASSMYTYPLNLSAANQVTFNFSFYATGFSNGEDFFLEISTNGGSSYSRVKTWIRGTNFNLNTRYNQSVIILNSSFSFSSNTVFRLRCDASSNSDNVYIDDVVITSCSSSQAAKNQTDKIAITTPEINNNETIKIYPNPASYELFIKREEFNSNYDVKMFTVTGLLVRNLDMNSETLRIDLNGLAEGLYLVRISNEKGKLIKSDRIIIKAN